MALLEIEYKKLLNWVAYQSKISGNPMRARGVNFCDRDPLRSILFVSLRNESQET